MGSCGKESLQASITCRLTVMEPQSRLRPPKAPETVETAMPSELEHLPADLKRRSVGAYGGAVALNGSGVTLGDRAALESEATDRLVWQAVFGEPAERDTARWLIWEIDRKSTRLNSSHGYISYAVFCLKK